MRRVDAPSVLPPSPPQAGGRHAVTLLFADLSRSTELADRLEAEQYAAVLAQLRHAYNTLVPRYGGMVVRVQGDGMLAMFGYPHTAEEDARHAVEAALALHEHVRQLDGGLSLHSGVHGGLVLIGPGDIERGRFDLLGPVPHIAARLSDRAGPHEVLVSLEALGPAVRHFDCGEPQDLQLKGRDGTVLAVSVKARALLQRVGRGAALERMLPILGRQAELARLRACMDTVAAGGMHTVCIRGPAGTGKSRLAKAVLEAAADWQVLQGHCDNALDAEPLQPFMQVLRTQGLATEPRLVAVTAALRGLLAPRVGAAPVLLFIDDWHWADDASQQVLQALREQRLPSLLVLLTARPGAERVPPAADDLTLDLQPLDDAAALELAARQLPEADPFVLATLQRRAGGNPLMLGELCHAVRRQAARGDHQGVLRELAADEDRGAHEPAGAAGWLAHLVHSRVQELPEEQAALLRAAAVLGHPLEQDLLERLTGHGADSPALRALAEHDLLFPAPEKGLLRFKHGLLRDAILGAIGLPERQLLHLRVAAALQHRAAQEPQATSFEALAYHFDAGGEPALASMYGERAGDRALAASALDRARRYYRLALAALDRLPPAPARARRWIEIVHRLGMVAVFDPTRADLGLTERALLLAGQSDDRALQARSRYWLAYIHYALGEALPAVRQGELALAEARAAGDEPLATQVQATLGEAHVAAGQYDRALLRLDEAIEIKRRHRSGRRLNVGLAFSLVCRACVLGDRGRFDDARGNFDEALGCLNGEQHQIGATIEGWRAAVLLWQGQWDAALAAAQESGRIARATRSLAQVSIAHAMQGYARWRRDGDAAALQDIVDATAWLAPLDTGLFRSLNHGWLCEGLLATGRDAAARHHAALAVQRARRSDWLGLAMTQRALALAAAAQGRHELAEQALWRASQAAERRESAHEAAMNALAAATVARLRGEASAAVRSDAAARHLHGLGMGGHLRHPPPWAAFRA
jgi:class 3 adenylate cyclase/tetratricopeptide (TPR) repeat protein